MKNRRNNPSLRMVGNTQLLFSSTKKISRYPHSQSSSPSYKNSSQQLLSHPHCCSVSLTEFCVCPYYFLSEKDFVLSALFGVIHGQLIFYTPCGISITTPAWISPHPISRQCFSTLLLSATFSPLLVQTGVVSCSLARSFLTAITRAPVDIDPMLSMSTSLFVSFETLPCFSVPLVRTPSNRRSKKKFTCTIPKHIPR